MSASPDRLPDPPLCPAPAPSPDLAEDELLGLGPKLKEFLEVVGLGVHEPHADPSPRLARYRIHRLIGEGGMGSVYEAEQQTPRRRVALDVIKEAADAGEERQGRPPRASWGRAGSGRFRPLSCDHLLIVTVPLDSPFLYLFGDFHSKGRAIIMLIMVLDVAGRRA